MRSSLVFFAGLLAATLCAPSWAAPPVAEAKSIPSVVGMFEAMKSGQIEVLYIPIDESRQAKLLIKNKTKVPLSLKLPANSARHRSWLRVAWAALAAEDNRAGSKARINRPAADLAAVDNKEAVAVARGCSILPQRKLAN